MPTSLLELAPIIVAIVGETKPRRVLDVGVGHGKYGLLMREYLGAFTELAGVEAEPRYLERFPWLGPIYDRLYELDVMELTTDELDAYDVVLMVDVLEHLTHEDGERLLRRIAGRVVVCTPVVYFQNPEASSYPTESHRSVWTADELAAIRRLEVEDVRGRELGAVLVRMAPLDV